MTDRQNSESGSYIPDRAHQTTDLTDRLDLHDVVAPARVALLEQRKLERDHLIALAEFRLIDLAIRIALVVGSDGGGVTSMSALQHIGDGLVEVLAIQSNLCAKRK